ncbi:hypothetical protein QBC44DRAFT_146883 [Cladorrhinum sp. PSN332]|nr:hypothetical protein QBC44DRAFT_146883 [Cladorrhinum sp. PSN332]
MRASSTYSQHGKIFLEKARPKKIKELPGIQLKLPETSPNSNIKSEEATKPRIYDIPTRSHRSSDAVPIKNTNSAWKLESPSPKVPIKKKSPETFNLSSAFTPPPQSSSKQSIPSSPLSPKLRPNRHSSSSSSSSIQPKNGEDDISNLTNSFHQPPIPNPSQTITTSSPRPAAATTTTKNQIKSEKTQNSFPTEPTPKIDSII